MPRASSRYLLRRLLREGLGVESDVVVARARVERVGAALIPNDGLDIGGTVCEQSEGLGALVGRRAGLGKDDVGASDEQARGARR